MKYSWGKRLCPKDNNGGGMRSVVGNMPMAALARREAGDRWLWRPSYVVITTDGSWKDLSTRFFTVHF